MSDVDIPSERDELLDQAILAMQAMPVPEVPVELLESTELAITRPTINSRPISGSVMRFALAASILLGLGSIFWFMSSQPTPAFAAMLKEVEAAKTFRGKIVTDNDSGTLTVSGSRSRFVSPDGKSEVLSDSSQGVLLQIDHRHKMAYHLPPNSSIFMLDVVGVLRKLASSASRPIEDYVSPEGARYVGMAGQSKWGPDPRNEMAVDIQVWTKPGSLLPARMTIRGGPDQDEILLVDEMEFDIPLDDTTFDLTIPEGYRVVGNQELKTPATAEEASRLVLKPGRGVGAVKFGMSREEIIAVMGEPEIVMHGIYLSYPSVGLQFILAGRKPNRLGNIIVNPSDAANLKRHDFPGQTEKGIKIGSTREEVIDAYGEPDPPRDDVPRHPVIQMLHYSSLYVTFNLLDGKVVQIFMNEPTED